VNGRLARKLRKLSEFKPHAERYYKCADNANNFVFGDDGQPKRIGGTWFEVTEKGNVVTNRAKYKYMKEKFYGGAI
jgi:hypothetical protein